jgi:hypothetical protein
MTEEYSRQDMGIYQKGQKNKADRTWGFSRKDRRI